MQTELATELTTIDALHFRALINPKIYTAIQAQRDWIAHRVNKQVHIEICNDYNDLNYLHVDNIKLNNQVIARLLSGNRKNKNDNKVRIELSNHTFYTNEWFKNYSEIKAALNLQEITTSRIEIAKDISNKKILETIHFVKSTRNIKTKINTSLSAYEPKYLNDTLNGATFGKKTSNLYITVYNKSETLKKQHKEYIKLYWFNNDLINTSNERIELILRNNNANHVEIEQLTDRTYLNQIFIDETAKRFRIVKEQKRNNKVKYIDETPFNLTIEDNKIYQYVKFKQIKKVANKVTLKQAKTCLKTTYLMYLQSNLEAYRQSYYALAKEYKLERYLLNNTPKWERLNNII